MQWKRNNSDQATVLVNAKLHDQVELLVVVFISSNTLSKKSQLRYPNKDNNYR